MSKKSEYNHKKTCNTLTEQCTYNLPGTVIEKISRIRKNELISQTSWNICLRILLFLCLTHSFFLAGMAISSNIIMKLSAPMALILSMLVGHLLTKRTKNGVMISWWIPLLVFALLLLASLVISFLFFDMSWDGLWYHQTAMYKISEGWNPVLNPMQDLQHHTEEYLRHYSKGSWYIGCAIYNITGNMELVKFQNWLALAAAFLSILSVSLDIGLNRIKSFTIAAGISMNPVVTCQLYSTYVDGLTISYLVCFLSAVIGGFKEKKLTVTIIIICSAILCINTKFTGLIYLGFFAAAIGAYCIIARRDMIIRYGILMSLAIFVGTAIFGYNPYITNHIHRGNIFYPYLGSQDYPSYADRQDEPIEKYETPHNMLDKNRVQRFGYAIFGRPEPFVNGLPADVNLISPFCFGANELAIYYFHEPRIAGFGPLFSGIFLLTIILFGIVMFRPKNIEYILCLSVITIISSLMLSKYSWWARYGPQLWFLPMIPVIGVFCKDQSRSFLNRYAWTIVVLFLADALLVAVAHLNWEIKATKTLSQQIAEIKETGPIEVGLQYFDYPFSKRLEKACVDFKALDRFTLYGERELISVCPSYPGTINYRYIQTSVR